MGSLLKGIWGVYRDMEKKMESELYTTTLITLPTVLLLLWLLYYY